MNLFVRLVGLGLGLVSMVYLNGAVSKVPEDLRKRLGLDPFYEKYTSACGLPVLGSEKVSGYGLEEAAYLINQMLNGREDVRQAMISNKVRFVVMAANEFTTAVPEHSTLTPAKYWDKRARGLGASPWRPVVSCGEENLLGYPGDPYSTENILIHEFAHAIHGMGLRSVDPTFNERLRKAYEEAKEKGLWEKTYAATNPGEYWAEAVQSWFDTNRENDAQHNHVNTREELKEYDPAVASLVKEMFGDGKWRYKKPGERPAGEVVHLRGYEPAKATRFEWPKELLEWNKEYAASNKTPESELVLLKLEKPDAGPVTDAVTTLRDTSILFINKRTTPVLLTLINSKGEKKPAGRLEGGEKRREGTYAGQSWLLSDEEGKAFAKISATTDPSKTVIEP